MTRSGYKKIYLPFSPRARDGDFLFYKAESDTILQNPFTSIDDVAPSNILQPHIEFMCFPSYWSSLNHAAAVGNETRVTEGFEQ